MDTVPHSVEVIQGELWGLFSKLRESQQYPIFQYGDLHNGPEDGPETTSKLLEFIKKGKKYGVERQEQKPGKWDETYTLKMKKVVSTKFDPQTKKWRRGETETTETCQITINVLSLSSEIELVKSVTSNECYVHPCLLEAISLIQTNGVAKKNIPTLMGDMGTDLKKFIGIGLLCFKTPVELVFLSIPPTDIQYQTSSKDVSDVWPEAARAELYQNLATAYRSGIIVCPSEDEPVFGMCGGAPVLLPGSRRAVAPHNNRVLISSEDFVSGPMIESDCETVYRTMMQSLKRNILGEEDLSVLFIALIL